MTLVRRCSSAAGVIVRLLIDHQTNRASLTLLALTGRPPGSVKSDSIAISGISLIFLDLSTCRDSESTLNENLYLEMSPGEPPTNVPDGTPFEYSHVEMVFLGTNREFAELALPLVQSTLTQNGNNLGKSRLWSLCGQILVQQR